MSKQQQNNMSDYESVIVTHVDNPTLFYCRIEQDIERYEQLKQLIGQHIDSEPHSMPDLFRCRNSSTSITALVYSEIHNEWCRARLISMKIDRNHKPICAKVNTSMFISFHSLRNPFHRNRFGLLILVQSNLLLGNRNSFLLQH